MNNRHPRQREAGRACGKPIQEAQEEPILVKAPNIMDCWEKPQHNCLEGATNYSMLLTTVRVSQRLQDDSREEHAILETALQNCIAVKGCTLNKCHYLEHGVSPSQTETKFNLNEWVPQEGTFWVQ